jgi:hypothetical protein
MPFVYQDPALKEKPSSRCEKTPRESYERRIQGEVFCVMTLAGMMILVHETDLDTVLVRGGVVVPDEVCP